jgi:FkbM family methyltransferase
VRVFNQIFVLEHYDPRQSQQWSWLEKRCARIVADGGRPVIVDCGANIGLSTVFFKNLLPAASIVAVEPEGRNFELLRRNCAPYADIVPIQAAISDRNGTVAISNPDAEGWAFRVTPVKPNGAGGIPAITVDDAIRAVPGGVPLMVKVDIEGAEEYLFRANLGWLTATPLVVVELHDWMRPWEMSSKNFLRAIANLDCDVLLRAGENIMVFNRDAIGARSSATEGRVSV